MLEKAITCESGDGLFAFPEMFMIGALVTGIRTLYHKFPPKFWVVVSVHFIDKVGGTLVFPFFALYITRKFQVGMTEAGILLGDEIAHLVHGESTSATMEIDLDLARTRKAGMIYVTDDVLVPNPWDALATYWGAELGVLGLLP